MNISADMIKDLAMSLMAGVSHVIDHPRNQLTSSWSDIVVEITKGNDGYTFILYILKGIKRLYIRKLWHGYHYVFNVGYNNEGPFLTITRFKGVNYA